MNSILPKLISENQSGFVKRRLITENILLTQDIIRGAKSKNAGGNVVIKLDMSKVYNKLSRTFLSNVLRKTGFSENFIEMIFRLISNNWYSVIINGTRYGFFQINQRSQARWSLLSPLFILAAEVFTKALSSLHKRKDFIGFSIHKIGPQINHLGYANDLVFFSSRNKRSINLIMKQFRNHQRASGQEINNDKSFFLTHDKTKRLTNRRIKRWTGYKQAIFPFTCLGCHIYEEKNDSATLLILLERSWIR